MRDPRLPAYQAWLPPSLLPSRMQFVDVRPAARLTGADAEGRIVAWRLHVSGIAAMDLPDAAAYGRHEWMGFVLRFTATWSGESKRTSVAPSQGGRSHSWAGEHTTLALPSVVGDSVPESELDIALCARIVGKPDEIIGAAKVSIASRSGAVSQLALLGPIFTGTNPTVSFRFDVTGVTRAQADREYSAGASQASQQPGQPQPLAQSRSVEELVDPSRQPAKHSFSTVSLLAARGSSSSSGARPASAGGGGDGGIGGGGIGGDGIGGGGDGGGGGGSGFALGDGGGGGYTTWEHSPAAGAVGGRSWLGRPASAQPSLAAVPTSARSKQQQQQLGAHLGFTVAEPPALPPSAAPPPPTTSSVGFGTAVPPPKTTPAPANNAAKGKPKGKGEPAKPAGLSAGAPKQEAWLRPIMAPSARMLMGLDECARIKAAFVKAGLACPTAALEKALLLPEDRPVPLCLSTLPRAGPEGRPLPCKDPILPSGKGGKKGKGKKGGKKGGKKKK
jgi:hypothetical protein